LIVYLLDTNICIEYLRNRDPLLVRRIRARPPAEIRLCSVVHAELHYGAYKSPPQYQAANFGLLAKFLPLFIVKLRRTRLFSVHSVQCRRNAISHSF